MSLFTSGEWACLVILTIPSRQQKTAAFLDHVHIQLCLCMVELQPAFADDTTDCVLRGLFLEVTLSPDSDFHFHWIMSVFDAVVTEGLKIKSNITLSHAHREFSRLSESFDIMFYRLWNTQGLHNFMLRNIILKLFTCIWTSTHLYFWQTSPLHCIVFHLVQLVFK